MWKLEISDPKNLDKILVCRIFDTLDEVELAGNQYLKQIIGRELRITTWRKLKNKTEKLYGRYIKITDLNEPLPMNIPPDTPIPPFNETWKAFHDTGLTHFTFADCQRIIDSLCQQKIESETKKTSEQ
jgi:hypothetical protein